MPAAKKAPARVSRSQRPTRRLPPGRTRCPVAGLVVLMPTRFRTAHTPLTHWPG